MAIYQLKLVIYVGFYILSMLLFISTYKWYNSGHHCSNSGFLVIFLSKIMAFHIAMSIFTWYVLICIKSHDGAPSDETSAANKSGWPPQGRTLPQVKGGELCPGSLVHAGGSALGRREAGKNWAYPSGDGKAWISWWFYGGLMVVLSWFNGI